jgi:3-deoxy-D-manno-octulosonate 8-phosphate phosphatase (KDO 8-P phosphatase)
MGDDLTDLPLMRRVGLALAPLNAVREVRAAADWIARRRGGEGAVREAIVAPQGQGSVAATAVIAR